MKIPLSSLRGDCSSRRREHADLPLRVGIRMRDGVASTGRECGGLEAEGFLRGDGIARVREMQTLVLGRKGKGRKVRMKGA